MRYRAFDRSTIVLYQEIVGLRGGMRSTDAFLLVNVILFDDQTRFIC